jgi:hypothetical protein
MTLRHLQANRRLTSAFIRESPHCIELQPYSKHDDDLGGWRYVAESKRPTQRFRLVEAGTPVGAAAISGRGIDGIERSVEYLMIGDHCADVELYDRFLLNDVEYEVVQIWPDNGYEVRVSIISRGVSRAG